MALADAKEAPIGAGRRQRRKDAEKPAGEKICAEGIPNDERQRTSASAQRTEHAEGEARGQHFHLGFAYSVSTVTTYSRMKPTVHFQPPLPKQCPRGPLGSVFLSFGPLSAVLLSPLRQVPHFCPGIASFCGNLKQRCTAKCRVGRSVLRWHFRPIPHFNELIK